jgi:hypothetical protein
VDLSFNTNDQNQNTITLIPDSVSPVLKQNMDIQIDSAFPYALNADDFLVTFISKSDPNYTKMSKVVKVDDANKKLTIKFGGALSGLYNVEIVHNQWGRLDTDALTLTVESYVTAMTPSVGSIFGGTLMTITGKNFGTVATDNPVELFMMGKPSVKCYV